MKARNCFDNNVTESDNFLALSFEGQLAYFHACANAGSDGHIQGAIRVLRSYGFGTEVLQELYDSGLFLNVNGECYVRDHWTNNGYDGRWFGQTMARCKPYVDGILEFEGEAGKSAYRIAIADISPNNRRLNDADMVCSAVDCSETDVVGSVSDMGCDGGGTEGEVGIPSADLHPCQCKKCGGYEAHYWQDGDRYMIQCPSCGTYEFDNHRTY